MLDVTIQHAPATQVDTPLLVLDLFEAQRELSGAAAELDTALEGLLSRLIADGEATGKLGEITLVHTPPSSSLKARRVALVGLGPRERFGYEAVRVAAATVARAVREKRLERYASVVHGTGADEGGLDGYHAARVLVEAACLALYRYEQLKFATKSAFDVAGLTLVAADEGRADEASQAVEHALAVARAMYWTRDLAIGPPNLITPSYLAEQARVLALRHGLEATVWETETLREKGMGGLLAVNAGSSLPPAFVALRYTAPGATRTLAVVGKGITFDSGGISIKPAEEMDMMRMDMTGAATVLGFMQLAAETRLDVNLLGIFAATENLPSGSAYKPGDVYRAYNGKSMFIVDTDAEGRVVLSDALSYAAEQQPDAIIDLATLTGGVVTALGNHATGLFTNSQPLADALVAVGEVSGDRCWQLPMWDVYHEQITSYMADIKNSAGRRASAITAAHFLKEFVGETPWVHLDIAGTAYTDGGQKYIAPYNPDTGPTGVGVRLLWHFCQAWAGNGS